MKQIDTLLESYRNWEYFTPIRSLFHLLWLICCVHKISRLIGVIFLSSEPHNLFLCGIPTSVVVAIRWVIEFAILGSYRAFRFFILLPSIVGKLNSCLLIFWH